MLVYCEKMLGFDSCFDPKSMDRSKASGNPKKSSEKKSNKPTRWFRSVKKLFHKPHYSIDSMCVYILYIYIIICIYI